MKKSKPEKKYPRKKRNLYAMSELIKRWEREELTLEQAIGQILLWLNDISERLQQVEAKQRQQKSEAN